jgi:tetratricopeptide (TPR) repeat protein
MHDPHHLRAMMHGDHDKKGHRKHSKGKKGHIEEELDQEIDAYVDSLELEEGPNALESVKAKREKIRNEIKEGVKLPELTKLLESAMGIVISEGERYLSAEENGQLLSDFANAAKYFAAMHLAESSDKNLQELIHISDDSMKSIVQMALAKFTEERFADCLALFSLLSILNPAYSEYWYRLGIAAQKCGNYDLALRAYHGALQLDPHLIGAKLFTAECLIELKRFDEAKSEIAEAKKMANEQKVDQMWIDLIPAIEKAIK